MQSYLYLSVFENYRRFIKELLEMPRQCYNPKCIGSKKRL